MPDDIPRALADALAARISALESTVDSLRAEIRELRSADSPSSRAVQPASPALPGRPPRTESSRASLESRIGGQLLNRIGILAVLIGMAWFLKLAFDRNWVGPPLRVLTGLFLAAALVVWSERFRRKGYLAFAYSLKALGTGIAYLSLWAASSVFHLAPKWLVFVAMVAVTVANAALAWIQASEILGLYALAGGLATPGLLVAGLGNETFLFSYLLLLNLGALALMSRHGWSRLSWAALLGTAFYCIGWTLGHGAAGRGALTAFFVILFFALFAAAPFLLLRSPGLPARAPLGAMFPVAFPLTNGLTCWVALLLLYGSVSGREGRFWATLLLAAAHFAMAWAARSTGALSSSCLGLGVFLAMVAVPLWFEGYQVILFWLGASLLLIVLARAWAHTALRVCGTGALMATCVAFLVDWIAGTAHPLPVVANMHFATALAGAAVFATVAVISLRAHAGSAGEPGAWHWLAGFASTAFSLTLLISVSLEIHHYWFCGAGFYRDFCAGYGKLEFRRIAAGFGLSAWWMVYGAALMAAGFWRRSAFLRWQALAVLAASIAKVFANGVSLESQLYRVLSFLGLGMLLLAVSFAYQKDWLRLRN